MNVGAIGGYTPISYVNPYASTATGVVVTDVLPSGVKYIRFVASKGSYDASTGKWDIGELAKGDISCLYILHSLYQVWYTWFHICRRCYLAEIEYCYRFARTIQGFCHTK